MRLNYWGKAQSVETLSEGVAFVSSSSHGGLVLSHEMNRHVPEQMRNSDGCYEEDVDWAIGWTALRKAGIIGDEIRAGGRIASAVDDLATKTLHRWRPDNVKDLLGIDPDPESPILLQRQDYREAREKGWFLPISATSASAMNSVPEGLVGVILAPMHPTEDREDRSQEFYGLIDAEIYADSRLKSGLRIFEESEIIRIERDPWARPDMEIISPDEAYDIASSWGSYLRDGDPGAVFYSFPVGDARPQNFEHRQALLKYTDACLKIALDRIENKDAVRECPEAQLREDHDALIKLKEFFLFSATAPEASMEGPEL